MTSNPGKRLIITLRGPQGSGKTVLHDLIEAALSDKPGLSAERHALRQALRANGYVIIEDQGQ